MSEFCDTLIELDVFINSEAYLEYYKDSIGKEIVDELYPLLDQVSKDFQSKIMKEAEQYDLSKSREEFREHILRKFKDPLIQKLRNHIQQTYNRPIDSSDGLKAVWNRFENRLSIHCAMIIFDQRRHKDGEKDEEHLEQIREWKRSYQKTVEDVLKESIRINDQQQQTRKEYGERVEKRKEKGEEGTEKIAQENKEKLNHLNREKEERHNERKSDTLDKLITAACALTGSVIAYTLAPVGMAISSVMTIGVAAGTVVGALLSWLRKL